MVGTSALTRWANFPALTRKLASKLPYAMNTPILGQYTKTKILTAFRTTRISYLSLWSPRQLHVHIPATKIIHDQVTDQMWEKNDEWGILLDLEGFRTQSYAHRIRFVIIMRRKHGTGKVRYKTESIRQHVSTYCSRSNNDDISKMSIYDELSQFIWSTNALEKTGDEHDSFQWFFIMVIRHPIWFKLEITFRERNDGIHTGR